MLRMLSIVVVALGCLWSGAALGDPPEVFDKRAYAEAKAAAEEGKRWLIVKATAEWCVPCKKMDATTWRDEKVVGWIRKNGVAVMVDVDKEEKLAGELKIDAMPTMIAFKGGKEFDRIVGYKSPEDFLSWLEGIARGEKAIEAVRKRAAVKDGERQDIQARMDLAEQLAREGKAEEAAAEYVWLWKNMLEHQPSMYGVRLSFMVSDMQELARASREARKVFTEVRDEAGKALEKEKVVVDDVVDWVALNRVLNDGAATLKWYDKVKGEARWKGLVSRVSRDLAALFVESRRWADLGRLYADPVLELEREHSFVRNAPESPLPKDLDEATRKQIRDIPARLFREKTSRVYAGLLAAGRDAEAGRFVARAYELEKDALVIKAYVELALDIGEPRAEQIRLIEGVNDPAVPLGALKGRVEKELEKKEAK